MITETLEARVYEDRKLPVPVNLEALRLESDQDHRDAYRWGWPQSRQVSVELFKDYEISRHEVSSEGNRENKNARGR